MRKVTIKDIAREAEVSAATVSYVLNNVENQKIAEDTRNKIHEIAQRLNYVPNLTARTLAKRKSGLVGILITKDYMNDKPWREFYYFSFINKLEKLLSQRGYHVLISSVDISKPKLDIIVERELDGVFILDVKKEVFFKLSNKFNVPIIAVDSYIDDVLFHKIIMDFDGAVEKARELLELREGFLVTDKFNNDEVIQRIRESSGLSDKDIYVMEDEAGLESFLRGQQGKKGIVINEFIGAIASKYSNPEDMAVICFNEGGCLLPDKTRIVSFDCTEKSAAAVKLIMEYMDGNYYEDKYKYTVIKAD